MRKNFLEWFYNEYKKVIKQVTLFLIGCLGIYLIFLMLTPCLPLFSNLPVSEYKWLHIVLYFQVCLFSFLGVIFYNIIIEIYTDYMKSIGKEIKFKVKIRWVIYTIVIILVFTNIGHISGSEQGNNEGYANGFKMGFATTTRDIFDNAVPASISTSLESKIFNFSDMINKDGSVTKEITISTSLIIENMDKNKVAVDPVLTIYNPRTYKYGIKNDLRNNNISIKINGADMLNPYISGLTLCDLYPFDEKLLTTEYKYNKINLNITVTFPISPPGTFKDNATYDCLLFLFQSKAKYVDNISFRLKT